MWRWGMCLAVLAVLVSGVASAQVTGDADAAAPIVYSSSAPSDEAAYAPAAEDDNADAQEVDAAPDYIDDDDDVSADEAAVDFYPGVSLLPVDYWDPTFGWTYFASFGYGYGYSWPTFGFGWPYWGLSWYGGGYWHHHHRYAWGGHHHHGGWNRYQFHYNDPGRYADRRRGGVQPAPATRLNSAPRTLTVAHDRARFPALPAHAPINVTGSGLARRATLPSASYVAAQRGRYAGAGGYRSIPTTTTRPSNRISRDAGYARSYRNDANARAANNVRNASQSHRSVAGPNRGYATSTYRSNPPMRYPTPMPRAGYATPHYSGNYSAAARGTAPSTGRTGVAPANSSGGHSGTTYTRQH